MRYNRVVHLKKQSGFTLLEVLVALAVLALGMGAVIKVVSSQTMQVSYLKEKTIAQWIASNKANEVQLGDWPATGSSGGSEFMAQQEWHWKLTVSNTQDKDLRRLDIVVSRADQTGEPLVRFIAFKGHPQEKKKNTPP